MNAILGLVVTIGMVFGGYLLAGGHMEIIMHALPFEGMMIGGAAIGAFLASNDFNPIKHTGGDLMAAIAGPKWKKSDYQDLLCLMHELLNTLKANPVDIEAHIEAPHESAIFTKYPKILKDHDAIDMICDTLRSMIMNFDNVHQVEELLEKRGVKVRVGRELRVERHVDLRGAKRASSERVRGRSRPRGDFTCGGARYRSRGTCRETGARRGGAKPRRDFKLGAATHHQSSWPLRLHTK